MSALNSNHHFTEEIFRIPFVTLPFALVIGGDGGPTPLIVGAILAMQGLYEHSCTRLGLGPLRYIISDNRYHRIHHSIEAQHAGKNFGSFTPVWDVVFGNCAFLTKRNGRNGIVDADEPRTIVDFLLRPFRWRVERPAGNPGAMATVPDLAGLGKRRT
jgi:sterol desaturase/sphingolipid hydroxylase (fatty acid hydroxylase superfamily)